MTLQNNDLLKLIKTKRAFRQKIAFQSHRWFFRIYMSHYLTHPIAWFHEEMFDLTEDKNLKLAVVMAFRGSGKSTIMNLSYTLWAIFGKPQKKFILIISRTKEQARIHLENLKIELESNMLLINDFGPFLIKDNEFGWNSIEFKKMGVKIMTAGSMRNFRGLRYSYHRPDLVICDDMDDVNSPEFDDQNEAYGRFINEIFFCGDSQTKFIVLGNLLHRNCMLMKLKENIQKGLLKGVFRAYPLVDADDRITWPGKYKTVQEIVDIRDSIPAPSIWKREYLLVISKDYTFMLYKSYYTLDEFLAAEKKYKEEHEAAINSYGFRINVPRIETAGCIFDYPQTAENHRKELLRKDNNKITSKLDE